MLLAILFDLIRRNRKKGFDFIPFLIVEHGNLDLATPTI